MDDAVVSTVSFNEYVTDAVATVSVPPSFDLATVDNPTPTPTRMFGQIFFVCLSFTGITGNILNLVVMSRGSMSTLSSTVYLKGLAVADILALTFQSFFKYAIFKAYGVTDPPQFFAFLCVYNNWILVGSVRTSFWITVGFTIERYIAIGHPLKGKTWCTVSKAKKSVAVIFVCAYSYAVYNLLVRYVGEDGKCHFRSGFLESAMGKMNTACFIVTYLLVAIFNGLIIMAICRRQQDMKSMATKMTNSGDKFTKKKFGRGSELQVTMTLLTVSAVFMTLNFPWLIYYTSTTSLPNNVSYNSYEVTSVCVINLTKQINCSQRVLDFCCEVMGPMNAAINFFLYNLTSQRFRKEFLRILRQASFSFCCGESPGDITRSTNSNCEVVRASVSARVSKTSV